MLEAGANNRQVDFDQIAIACYKLNEFTAKWMDSASVIAGPDVSFSNILGSPIASGRCTRPRCYYRSCCCEAPLHAKRRHDIRCTYANAVIFI